MKSTCDIETAYRSLRRAFRDDPGYRECWQANIACVLMDKMNLEYEERMDVANAIMRHMFEGPDVEAI